MDKNDEMRKGRSLLPPLSFLPTCPLSATRRTSVFSVALFTAAVAGVLFSSFLSFPFICFSFFLFSFLLTLHAPLRGIPSFNSSLAPRHHRAASSRAVGLSPSDCGCVSPSVEWRSLLWTSLSIIFAMPSYNNQSTVQTFHGFLDSRNTQKSRRKLPTRHRLPRWLAFFSLFNFHNSRSNSATSILTAPICFSQRVEYYEQV